MPNSKFTASYKDGKILKLETALCYDKETNEYYFYLYHNKCLFKKKRIGYIQFRIIYGDLSFEKLNISSAIKIWHNSIDKQYRGYQLGTLNARIVSSLTFPPFRSLVMVAIPRPDRSASISEVTPHLFIWNFMASQRGFVVASWLSFIFSSLTSVIACFNFFFCSILRVCSTIAFRSSLLSSPYVYEYSCFP